MWRGVAGRARSRISVLVLPVEAVEAEDLIVIPGAIVLGDVARVVLSCDSDH